ncbi:MAG TPA: cobyrinate a,c-diamide synthase [Steroidobacteraceae bacterium]|nr:cobyrinate a,c-diamide synthase [Steroidobacteraceae bacterium]
MLPRRRCPALFVSAPASGQGKTTVTAALARHHASRGCAVQVFKTGPDFIDPMILERASGRPVYQLDLWMGGESHCRRLLYDAAGAADLILIEGVMGLYDGVPSSADLARLFGIPVLAVIDAGAMAQTFGAISYGLAHYSPPLAGDGVLAFYGVLANRVAGPGHSELAKQGVPESLRFLGGMTADAALELPDRHLGLVQAEEIGDLDQRLSALASALENTELADVPPPIELRAPAEEAQSLERPLAGVRIGVARDQAFSFLYRANLDQLRALGAELVFFSPLAASDLPPVDSVYLPGGYPELHLERLSANRGMAEALKRHVHSGKPTYAECGGMLYLLESLRDARGKRATLAAVLPGHALMHTRLQSLGYHTAPLPGGKVRGHSFHHSTVQTPLAPAAHTERAQSGAAGEPIYRHERLLASYFHGYFPSNPQAVAQLFKP